MYTSNNICDDYETVLNLSEADYEGILGAFYTQRKFLIIWMSKYINSQDQNRYNKGQEITQRMHIADRFMMHELKLFQVRVYELFQVRLDEADLTPIPFSEVKVMIMRG